jgi:hypothetical protein
MTKKFHQQELDNQYGLQPSTSDSGHQQHQVPNISQRKNLISYNKMISSPFSLFIIISAQRNQPNCSDNCV